MKGNKYSLTSTFSFVRHYTKDFIAIISNNFLNDHVVGIIIIVILQLRKQRLSTLFKVTQGVSGHAGILGQI